MEWNARGMGSLVVVLLLALAIGFVVTFIQRHRRSLVGQRGMSIGADLGALSDQPRARVADVTRIGPDSIRLVLTPEAATDGGPAFPVSDDLVFVVSLGEADSGYQLLQEWRRSGSSLAVVIPPGSRLVRLRSIDSLQPLTLRRVDAD
jgi:hypothetical protein